MAITIKQWKILKPQITVGCTFEWLQEFNNSSIVIGTVKTVDGLVDWNEVGYMSKWPLFQCAPSLLKRFGTFRDANGLDMLTGEPTISPVYTKIANLNQRFKDKTLPKTRQKAIPFPDKKKDMPALFSKEFDTWFDTIPNLARGSR